MQRPAKLWFQASQACNRASSFSCWVAYPCWRTGWITRSRNTSAEWVSTAICRLSRDWKWANRPLFDISQAVAREPMVRLSSPCWLACSNAVCKMVSRVRRPLLIRLSSLWAGSIKYDRANCRAANGAGRPFPAAAGGQRVFWEAVVAGLLRASRGRAQSSLMPICCRAMTAWVRCLTPSLRKAE